MTTAPKPAGPKMNLTLAVGLVCVTILLIVILGVFLRLQLAHTDSAPYITFLTTILTLMIPTGIAAYQSSKSRHAAEEAKTQSAKTVAQTNGVMNGAMTDIKSIVDGLAVQMTEHLEQHAAETVPPVLPQPEVTSHE